MPPITYNTVTMRPAIKNRFTDEVILAEGWEIKDLTGADLAYANLRRADLTGADLAYADLTGADLAYANLRRADLTGANLRRADLTGANLYRADLIGANLYRATLQCVQRCYQSTAGSENRLATWLPDHNKVQVGCRMGETLEEALGWVHGTYPDPNNRFRKQYEGLFAYWQQCEEDYQVEKGGQDND